MSLLTGLSASSGLSAISGGRAENPIDWAFLVRADAGVTASGKDVLEVVDQSTWAISTANGGAVVDVQLDKVEISPRGITPFFFREPRHHFHFGGQYVLSSNRPQLVDGYCIAAVVRSDSTGSRDFVADQGFFGEAGTGLIFSRNYIGGYTPKAVGQGGGNGNRLDVLRSPETTGWHVVSKTVQFAASGSNGLLSLHMDDQLLGSVAVTVDEVGLSNMTVTPTRQGGSGPLTIGLQAKSGGDAGRGFDGELLAAGICPASQAADARAWLQATFL